MMIVRVEIAHAPKKPKAPLLRLLFGFAGVEPKIGLVKRRSDRVL